ncbi:hypothetical protein FRC08_001991 [Ceratobasidium sp. 394]|nr:hypothetical protein FRC08_001991 [Ceratobasidium sp. 394]
MVVFKFSILPLVALLASTYAAPTDLPILDKRAVQVLANGTAGVGGNLPDWGLLYRASGYLAKGGCPKSAGITKCYVQKLSSDPKKNIDALNSGSGQPVQTNFITTGAIEATGGVTKYTFKMYIDPSLKTPAASGPHQLVQVVSKEPVSDGPQTKVYFDAKNNLAGIYAFNDNKPVASVPLSKFTGKTVLHSWTVKGGPGGYVHILITDAKTGKTVLKYDSNKQSTVDSYRQDPHWPNSQRDEDLALCVSIQLAYIPSQFTYMHLLDSAYWGDWSAKLISK